MHRLSKQSGGMSNSVHSPDGGNTNIRTCSARRLKHGRPFGASVVRVDRVGISKENNMRKLITICFALALLTAGVASAQDTMQNDTMKADSSKKAVQVTGKISESCSGYRQNQ